MTVDSGARCLHESLRKPFRLEPDDGLGRHVAEGAGMT
jgi:hypothetical protein